MKQARKSNKKKLKPIAINGKIIGYAKVMSKKESKSRNDFWDSKSFIF